MDVQKKEIIKKMFKSIYGVGYIILFLVGLAFILSATINIHLDKKQSIEYKKVVATYHSYNKLESTIKFSVISNNFCISDINDFSDIAKYELFFSKLSILFSSSG